MTGDAKRLAFCQALFTLYQAQAHTLEGEIEDGLSEGSPAHPKALCDDNPDRCEQDYWYFDMLGPDRVKISSAFEGDYDALRFMTLKLDTDHYDIPMEIIECRGIDTHSILRTEGGEVEIKALVYQDKEGIETLTLRRWDQTSGRTVRESFSLSGEDLDKFMVFLVSAFFVRFRSDGKMTHMLSKLDRILHEVVETEKERAEAHEARMASYRERWTEEAC